MPEPKILVVDDGEDTREALVEWLRMHGFSTEEASNGQEALDRARVWSPDVVVMDLNMPIMDGLEATRALRDHEHLRNVPVLLVTGSGLGDLTARAKIAGVDVVLPKPCSPKVVLAEIHRLLAAG